MATNFLQHNPTEANQDSDAQYVVDNTRTQGLGVDEIVPSIWMNKVLYQASTFVAAFAQMMSNKGYNCSDADINALSAVLANVITNADTKPGFINVPYSSAPVFNAALGNGFRFNLQAAVPSSTLINQTFGQILTFVIQNNMNVDPGVFTWPTNVLDGYTISLFPVSHINTQQFIVLEDGNAYSITTMVDRLISLYNSTQAQINNLQAQINSINGQIPVINSHLTTLDGNVASLGGRIDNVQSQINGIQTNKQNNLGFTPVQQGGGAGQLSNKIFVGWNGGRLKGQVDVTDLGNFVFDNNMAAAIAAAISGLFAGSLGSAGWIALGSLIIQWGSTPILNPNNSQTFNFPRQFPNQCFQVNVSCMSSPSNQGRTVFTRGWNQSQYTVGANGNDCSISWIAFGI